MENRIEKFSDKENYIMSIAIIELGGPYHVSSRFYDHLYRFHQKELDLINEDLEKGEGIFISSIPLVLDALYLMLETNDVDFNVICRNDIHGSRVGIITRDDVKILYNNLETAYKEES